MADRAQFANPDALAGAIKAKYPQYGSIGNTELSQRILTKYPEYWKHIDPAGFAKAGMWQPSSTEAKTTSTGQGPQGAAGKFVDKAAQGIVNAAPQVGMLAGGAVGAAAGGVGSVAGAAAGAGVGEAFKEKVEGKKLHDISNKEVAKQIGIGGLSEAGGIVGGKVLGKAIDMIPNKAAAGKILKGVMDKAEDLPVHLENSAEHLQRLRELKATGGGSSQAINKLLARTKNPTLQEWMRTGTKRPLTYKEARDFYSNISSLTAKDSMSLSPAMKRQLVLVAQNLKHDIGNTAAAVGKEAEYYAGLKQYAKAAKLADMSRRMAKWAGPKIGTAIATAAGTGIAGGLLWEGYKTYKGE